ncbi:MAG: radical SAM protein [Phycisphaerae bacterium]
MAEVPGPTGPHPSDATPRLDDAWILQRRGSRNIVDPHRPYACSVEPERGAGGAVEDVATIFITNRECPFRCLMCDLWKNTTEERVPDGAVAGQIEWALTRLPAARHLKLYNSGNFFDEQAVPRTDRARIAELVDGFETVVVECHPKLVDRRCVEFAASIRPRLEVAMGLETVDPEVLPRLNKRMTLADFDRSAAFLCEHGIAVRTFILVKTPFQSEAAGIKWACRSVDHAFDAGASCCVVIPTRAGNGAMEWLQRRGDFSPPSIRSLERVLAYGVGLRCGRVFSDLWDIERLLVCGRCATRRVDRMREMNRTQRIPPEVTCQCPEASVTGAARG